MRLIYIGMIKCDSYYGMAMAQELMLIFEPYDTQREYISTNVLDKWKERIKDGNTIRSAYQGQ